MKRVVLAVFLTGCSSSVGPGDSISPTVTMTLVENPVVVVRGQSTTVHLSLFEDHAVPLRVALGPLPDGLSATSADWAPGDPNAVPLTITAAADAPAAEIPFSVSATAGDTIVASLDGKLSVSELVGSLDPTFGTGGVVTPNLGASIKAVGMSQQADGKWMIVGSDANPGPQAIVLMMRLTENGAVDATFGEGGVLEVLPTDQVLGTNVLCAAFAPDDRIAVGLQRQDDSLVIVMDRDGNVLANVVTPHAPLALAWDGDALFVGSGFDVERLDASHQVTTVAAQSVSAVASPAPGAVLAYSAGPLELTRYDALAPSWTAPLPGLQNAAIPSTSLAIDSAARALVALPSSEIVRLLPDGTFDAVWGAAGVAPLLGGSARATWVHGLSSGGAVAVGLSNQGGWLVTALSPSGDTTAFGTFGRTLLCPTCLGDAAAVDASEKRVCVAQHSPLSNPFVACYRLGP